MPRRQGWEAHSTGPDRDWPKGTTLLFNSNAFLFVFLPLTLIAYYVVRERFGRQGAFLCLFAASIAFYGYWDIRYLALILGSIVVNFAIGRELTRQAREDRGGRLLVLGIVFNLGLLGFFKYLNFFVNNFNELAGTFIAVPLIVLPIGISFYTFQQIAYLVDAKRGEVGELGPIEYGLFVSFFPQLIAGPIVHHKEMMPQFLSEPERGKALEDAALGVTLFAIGLFKKTMIADNLALAATPVFSAALAGDAPHFFSAWTAALAYTFQIYFDFSGYSDMALGLALMFGIRLPANFNSPYKATNIVDFWRRWHMTLSRFLRDYLYFPLGGNRQGPSRRYANLMIVMLLGGFWHGAAWSFMLWGALHGLYLAINHAWQRFGFALRGPAGRLLAWAITFLAVVFAWVTFRAESLDAALLLYRAMLGFDGLTIPLEAGPLLAALGLQEGDLGIRFFAENSRADFYIGWLWIFAAGAIAVFAPNALQLTARGRPCVDFDEVSRSWPERRRPRLLPFWRASWPYAATTATLLFLALRQINAAAPSEFLYFQF